MHIYTAFTRQLYVKTVVRLIRLIRGVRSLDARLAGVCGAGIVVMVLLLLCGVKREAIVEDYMMSEQVLKQSRMHDELDLDGARQGSCPHDLAQQAGPHDLARLALLVSVSGAGCTTVCGVHVAGGPELGAGLGVGLGLGQLEIPSSRPPWRHALWLSGVSAAPGAARAQSRCM
jgi:hypothetical protein